MTRSKGQQVGFEPAPLQDSFLLGELEAAPGLFLTCVPIVEFVFCTVSYVFVKFNVF